MSRIVSHHVPVAGSACQYGTNQTCVSDYWKLNKTLLLDTEFKMKMCMYVTGSALDQIQASFS